MAFTITVCIFVVLFILTHLNPLADKQMSKLASKKRKKSIRRYFTFDSDEYTVDKGFKSSMNPDGQLYDFDLSLFEHPSIAAGLLKYKKHEWIIISFEKDKRVKACWLNKGFDRNGVGSFLSLDDMVEIAKKNRYSSVLIFHNHPNSSPHHFDLSKPSKQDLSSAKEFSTVLNQNGLNLLEFVCERGKHYMYFTDYSDAFLHVSDFLENIKKRNGLSKTKNLLLHLERFI